MFRTWRIGLIATAVLTAAVWQAPGIATAQPAGGLTSYQVVTGGLMPVGARTTGGAVAVCPRNTRAVAGGWRTSSLDGVAAQWSHPVPGSGGAADMWTVGIENAGGATVNLVPYAICLSGPTGIVVHRSAGQMAPHQEGGWQRYCEAGQNGFGGGMRTSAGGRVTKLLVAHHHWGTYRSFFVRNDTDAAVTHDNYAVCGTGLAAASYHEPPPVEVPARAVQAITADCPAGTVLVGGGGVHYPELRGDIVNSYPESSTRWVNQVRNPGDAAGRFATQIACGA